MFRKHTHYFENSPDLICFLNADGYMVDFNRRWTELLGWSGRELKSRPVRDLLHPEDSPGCLAEPGRIPDGGTILTHESRLIAKDGSEFWVHWSLAPMQNGQVSASVRDMTACFESKVRLAEQKRALELSTNIADIGHWQFDLKTRKQQWSDRVYEIFGVNKETFNPKAASVLSMIHPSDRSQIVKKFRDAISVRDLEPFKIRIVKAGGALRHVYVKAIVEQGKTEQCSVIFGVVQDITELEEAKLAAEYAARHDPLTELPNRAKFQEMLTSSLKRTKRMRGTTGLLLIDIDHFKDVNDTLGHLLGDKLLLTISARLQKCFSREVTIARLGGDEFAVIVDQPGSIEALEKKADEIFQAITGSYVLDDHEVQCSASMGIALQTSEEFGENTTMSAADQLAANADIALYAAKGEGRDKWVVFDQSMRARVVEHNKIKNELRTCMTEGQLVVHYQPQADTHTREIIGAEALVRWRHPEQGLLLPGAFLTQVEDAKLLPTLTRQVISMVCRDIRKAADRGTIFPRIAINIPPQLLKENSLLSDLRESLDRNGLVPEQLAIEVVETAFTGDMEIIDALNKLRESGMTVAVDDFGIGYSSLGRLHELPLDCIKIDRSFVKDVFDNPRRCALVETICKIAGSFDLNLVAEGVENTKQLEFLEKAGCPNVQGFLFSHALEWPEFEQLLAVSALGEPIYWAKYQSDQNAQQAAI